MEFKRASGVLMHIASLPSENGIGSLGKEAYKFVDFLKETGQTYWQILPVCPTSYGDSPYQGFSTFAGNPYFIDLDILCEQGYLKPQDYKDINWGETAEKVDYSLIYTNRNRVFQTLYNNFKENVPSEFLQFCKQNEFWLENFALFMAVKDCFGGKKYTEWDNGISIREQTAVDYYKTICQERIDYYKMLQFFFFSQWYALKDYANRNGIKIIGDLPIYVAEDSADVWSNPECFKLDKNRKPKEVAGCPPDCFSQDGQLWGNPVYDWRYMKSTGYDWWIKRLRTSFKIYDIVRIDHFRGFEEFYCIKYGEKTAKNGKWRKGPDIGFWNEVKRQLGDLPIIAEDLGFLTEKVYKLLEKSGFPGMKVLQFAFDSGSKNAYLPHNYNKNCVVYTGTHDNDTIKGWLETVSDNTLEYAKKYLNSKDNDLRKPLIISAMSSVADTCILTMQDLIGLGNDARMNTPSTLGGNWSWRAKPDYITEDIKKMLLDLTEIYGRER